MIFQGKMGAFSPLWTLVPLSLVVGAAAMWAFRRLANLEALGAAIHRIQAHLLEFWLFVDEPSLVGKSWRGLLAANARFLRLLLVPLAILSIPMVPLFFCLDACYGVSPLRVGKPALVTAALNQPLEKLSSPPELKAPDGVSVESPPVRVLSEREVSWRIRPERPLSGELQLVLDGTSLTKSIAAGEGCRYLSRKRTRHWWELVRYPTEAPLPAGPVDFVEVAYPPAEVRLFGFEAHWSVWFLVFSLVGALLAPR